VRAIYAGLAPSALVARSAAPSAATSVAEAAVVAAAAASTASAYRWVTTFAVVASATKTKFVPKVSAATKASARVLGRAVAAA